MITVGAGLISKGGSLDGARDQEGQALGIGPNAKTEHRAGQAASRGCTMSAAVFLRLVERAHEKVLHADDRGILFEIVSIQPSTLHADDGQDVPPLAIRHLTAAPEPPQFLQEDVFRRMDVQHTPPGDRDGHPSFDLLQIERRSAGHVNVHLQLCCLVNQIRNTPITHRPQEALLQVLFGTQWLVQRLSLTGFLRRQILASRPLCECKGCRAGELRVTRASVVHHVHPARGRRRLAHPRDPLGALSRT